MNWAIAALCAAVAMALIWRQTRSQQSDFEPSYPLADEQLYDTAPEQLPDTLDTFMIALQSKTSDVMNAFKDAPNLDSAAGNRKAFLDMISYAEGTLGPNGYRTMFGNGLFDNFADHPRQRFAFTNKVGAKLYTTAAGRYQFLSRTWDTLKARLQLPDFGPESQDLAALELIRERGALADVDAGRLSVALKKVAPIWASLPGAGHDQPERKLQTLFERYAGFGGNLEA